MANNESGAGTIKAKLEGGQKSLEAEVVFDLPLFNGNVQVGTKENVFSLNEARFEHKLILARQAQGRDRKLDFYRLFWYY